MSALKPKDRVRHIRLNKEGTCLSYNVIKKQWKVKWDNGKSTFCKVKSLQRLDQNKPKTHARKKVVKMSATKETARDQNKPKRHVQKKLNKMAATKETAPKLPTAANSKTPDTIKVKITAADDAAQTTAALNTDDGINSAKNKSNSKNPTGEPTARIVTQNATIKASVNEAVKEATTCAAPKLAPNEEAALFVKGAFVRGAGRFHDQRGFFQEMFNTGRDDFFDVKVNTAVSQRHCTARISIA